MELETNVAIKTITATNSERDGATHRRFKREARAAAQLRGPNIVRVFDYGLEGDTPYIAMELLEGEDIKAYLDRVGALPLARASEVVSQVAVALDTAHRAGVVHRDVKPRNIFLAKEGELELVKLLDFGVAKHTTEVLVSDDTASGAVVGSPRYMSPEQARGERVDARSDIWSLGIVAFELLSGEPPFTATVLGALIGQVLNDDVPDLSLRAPSLPSELDSVVRRALTRNPSDRYATAGQFAEALQRVSQDHPDLPSAAPGPRTEVEVSATPYFGRSSTTVGDASESVGRADAEPPALATTGGTMGPVDRHVSVEPGSKWGSRIAWTAAGSIVALGVTWLVNSVGSQPAAGSEPSAEVPKGSGPALASAPTAAAPPAESSPPVVEPRPPETAQARPRETAQPPPRAAKGRAATKPRARPKLPPRSSASPAQSASAKPKRDSDFGIPLTAPK